MSTWSPTLFAGRRYAVVGLGRNGLPAAQVLAAMGADIRVWDDSEPARAAATLPLHNPAQGYRGFDALILSPGIPHTLPAPHPAAQAARHAGIPILSDAELLYQAATKPSPSGRGLGEGPGPTPNPSNQPTPRFVGITGTNGKSTTTALLHHVLLTAGIDSAAGGNLGTAALALPRLNENGIYVLEMSSYMLERLNTLRFDAAALLNLSPDHLDRHGDMGGYIAAKRHIFDRQTARDTAILGIDDPASAALADAVRCQTISGHQPATVWADATHLRDSAGPVLPLADLPTLPGPHNAQNAAATIALARALGVADPALMEGLQTFGGLPHRQQRIPTADGLLWVNDSKATNADAAARALACYNRVIWIAGGQAKAGGIEPLAPFFPRVAHALLIGRDAPLLAKTLAAAGIPHSIPGTLEAAAAAAPALARRLDAPTILLSPACASFDQFPGFEARGDRFAHLARGATLGRTA